MATLTVSSLCLRPSSTVQFRVPQHPPLHLQKSGNAGSTISIQCATRPRLKSTKHHNATRPRKKGYQARRRKGPAIYPPLTVRPPVWDILPALPGAKAQFPDEVSDEPAASNKASAPTNSDENDTESGASGTEVDDTDADAAEVVVPEVV